MTLFLYCGLPIGDIPPTPAIPYIDPNATTVASNLLLSYAEKFGKVFSYKQEQNGQIVQNIVPVHKTEYSQISTSSKTELHLHTEAAFHSYRPSHLLLLCLRGDETAFTTYADLDDILEGLSEHAICVLQEKLFKTSIDESFRTNGEEDIDIPTSVLSNDGWGNYSIIYDRALMTGITSTAQAALDALQVSIDDNTTQIALGTGDLLVIDNSDTVHGRKPFQPRYDGTDRWVQRVLVRESIDGIESSEICPLTGYTIITKIL